MKPAFMFVGILILAYLVTGCSVVGDVREDIYSKSMKVFDEVEYKYHRKGNIIQRELMATGEEKIVPEDDLQVPGVP